MRCCQILTAAFLLFTAPIGTAASADDASPRPAERLFRLAAAPSAKNLREVEECYRLLSDSDRRQPLLKYAYSIALIQQRRLHEAATLVREVAQEQPERFAFCRTSLWLALTLGERTKALAEIERLAGHARTFRDAEHEPLAEPAAAEFLGAVCGFVAGPWSGKVRPADAQRIEEGLRTLCGAESRPAFDRSKAAVGERFQQLSQAHQERSQADLATETKLRDKANQAVAQAGQAVEAKAQAIKNKEKKRDRDAQAKLGLLDDELKKIDERRQALLMEIAPLEAQRVALISQLIPVPSPFSRRTFNINQGRILAADNQYNRTLGLLLAPTVAKLTTLETEVASLNQAEQEHLFSIGATEIKHQTDVNKLARQEQALDKDKKRIAYDAQRLKARPLASNPRSRTEAQRLTRFSTYVPFDFEHEKKWILDSLPNDKGP